MPRPRSDIRPRLLVAARELFLTSGVEGASLRDIAREAGTNIGMIYYYFETKDDLFEAVIAELFPRIVERVSAALAPDVPFEQRFERMFLNIGRMSDEELVTVRLLVREVMVSSERRRRVLGLALKAHIPIVFASLLEGLHKGELDARHPIGVMGVSLFGIAMFSQLVRRLAGDALPPALGVPEGDDLAKALCQIWLHGVRPA